jgi:putative membrane protein insertion efficiency factor
MIKNILIATITIYKKFFSPQLRFLFGGGCRFVPTCSDYACFAIEKHGVIKGSYLALKRFFKCNPIFNLGVETDLSKL